VRFFPGGVAGLFPCPDFGSEGLGDASVPPDDVGVETGGCGRGVDRGRSALVLCADGAGEGVGLMVFTGSVDEAN
jgi:hypothetical protein